MAWIPVCSPLQISRRQREPLETGSFLRQWQRLSYRPLPLDDNSYRSSTIPPAKYPVIADPSSGVDLIDGLPWINACVTKAAKFSNPAPTTSSHGDVDVLGPPLNLMYRCNT
jgi:hypothetical protein